MRLDLIQERGEHMSAFSDRAIGYAGPEGEEGLDKMVVSGFKGKSCIWLHSRENFAYVIRSAELGPDRPRPARQKAGSYPTSPSSSRT